jgi:DnaJ homolog subfamily C member 28
MITGWRSALRQAWANRSEDDGSRWNDDCRVLQEQTLQINDKVHPLATVLCFRFLEEYISDLLFCCKIAGFLYNLIVPFGCQMFGLNWDKELDKLKLK